MCIRDRFWGCAPRGLRPPNSNSAEIFVQCTYPKFYHPMFTHLEVIVSTNKYTHTQTNQQLPLKISNALRYTTTLGKKSSEKLLKNKLTHSTANVHLHCKATLVNFTDTLFHKVRHFIALRRVARNCSQWFDAVARWPAITCTTKYLQTFLMNGNPTLTTHTNMLQHKMPQYATILT